jgi:2-iminobutanoate/2-iminopropanoate deaminase
MTKTIFNPEIVPKPMGPYSQGVVTTGGKLVFISGQVPQDASGNLVGKNDLEAQTKQVLENLKTMVETAGGTVANIAKITIFMVKVTPRAYEILGRVRREFWGTDFPASTLVEINRLASPDFLIEIEAFAVI